MKELIKTLGYWTGVVLVILATVFLMFSEPFFVAGSWAILVGAGFLYYYPVFGIIGGLLVHLKRSRFDVVLLMIGVVQVVLVLIIPRIASVEVTMNLKSAVVLLLPSALLLAKVLTFGEKS